MGLARLARDSGDLAAALKIIDKSSVADGGEFILREITAADIMEKMGDKDAALKRIVNAHKTTPDNARLIYFHALLAESAGHIDQAIALLRRMTKLYPKTPMLGTRWAMSWPIITSHWRKRRVILKKR